MRDVMLDEVLLRFLSHSEAPTDPVEYSRVLKASRFMYMDAAGRVWLRGDDDVPPRQIPLLKNRPKIITSSLTTGAYPSGDRLYSMLRQAFYWPGMLLDCREAASAALPRQLE